MGLVTNHIAPVAEWVNKLEITFPVMSDFASRLAAANIAGLNADGTARRGGFIIDPNGMLVWEHVCDDGDAAHHVSEALKALGQATQPQMPTAEQAAALVKVADDGAS